MNTKFHYIKKRTGHVRIKVTLKRVRVAIVAVEKTVNITYSECAFVNFGIQYAERMRPITLSSVACPAVQYFSTLSHKRQGFFSCGAATQRESWPPHS
jgi:hypothetical protein